MVVDFAKGGGNSRKIKCKKSLVALLNEIE